MNLLNKTIEINFKVENVHRIEQYLLAADRNNLTSKFVSEIGQKAQIMFNTKFYLFLQKYIIKWEAFNI